MAIASVFGAILAGGLSIFNGNRQAEIEKQKIEEDKYIREKQIEADTIKFNMSQINHNVSGLNNIDIHNSVIIEYVFYIIAALLVFKLVKK